MEPATGGGGGGLFAAAGFGAALLSLCCCFFFPNSPPSPLTIAPEGLVGVLLSLFDDCDGGGCCADCPSAVWPWPDADMPKLVYCSSGMPSIFTACFLNSSMACPIC